MGNSRRLHFVVAAFLLISNALPLTAVGLLAPAALSDSSAQASARHSRTDQPSPRRRLSRGVSKVIHAPGRALRASKRFLSAHHRSIARKSPRVIFAAKPRSCYPPNFFIWSPPGYSLASETCSSSLITDAFDNGQGSKYTPQELVQAGVFTEEPLRGGIFIRREPVKYIILHSTETGRPADAVRVIHSWNRGMRHPGAQYIVDRDGTIYQTVDPEYGTVHVDIHRTLGGVNNDNTVGIEIVHTGEQEYTAKQLDKVTKLVSYLQGRFSVTDDHILRHGDVQPSDRHDPVAFDFPGFMTAKSNLRSQMAMGQKSTYAGIPSPMPLTQTTDQERVQERIIEQSPFGLFGLTFKLPDPNIFKAIQEFFGVQL